MDFPLLEGLVSSLYEELGYDPREPEAPGVIARAWLGAESVVRARSTLPTPACTFFVNGQRVIAVKPGLPAEAKRFWISHELGHALLARANQPDSERAADYLAAAIMAPYPFARGYQDDWRSLAADIGSTQTQAALRTAEVLGLPRAVVTLAAEGGAKGTAASGCDDAAGVGVELRSRPHAATRRSIRAKGLVIASSCVS